MMSSPINTQISVKLLKVQFLFILRWKVWSNCVFFLLTGTQMSNNTRHACVRACVFVCVLSGQYFHSASLHRMPGTPAICVLWLRPGCCFSPGSCFGDKDRRGIEITQRPRHTPDPPQSPESLHGDSLIPALILVTLTPHNYPVSTDNHNLYQWAISVDMGWGLSWGCQVRSLLGGSGGLVLLLQRWRTFWQRLSHKWTTLFPL